MAVDFGANNSKLTTVKTKEYFVNEGNKLGYMDRPKESDGVRERYLKAGTDLHKGRFVHIDGDFTVKEGAVGKTVLGVAMFDAKTGEECAVETEGCFKVETGGAITAGARVASDANGKAVAYTAPTESQGTVTHATSEACGIALNGASASGKFIYIKFTA